MTGKKNTGKTDYKGVVDSFFKKKRELWMIQNVMTIL